MLLLSIGLTYLVFGVWLLIHPSALDGYGIVLESATARADMRATYGGFEIGVGLFFLCASMVPVSEANNKECQENNSRFLDPRPLNAGLFLGVLIPGSVGAHRSRKRHRPSGRARNLWRILTGVWRLRCLEAFDRSLAPSLYVYTSCISRA